jgi:hypothetical protein
MDQIGAANGDRQGEEGQCEQREVQERTAARPETVRHEVRVPVTEEEGGLEEDHGRGPDLGRPAECGEKRLRDHRLDEEHEAGRDEYRRAEQGGHSRSLANSLALDRPPEVLRADRDPYPSGNPPDHQPPGPAALRRSHPRGVPQSDAEAVHS